MKKISPKRVAIGTLVGSGLILGLIFGLIEWFNNPAFPYLRLSDERNVEKLCVEEISNQPYVNKEYYTKYFEDCLLRGGEKNPIVVPSETLVDGVG